LSGLGIKAQSQAGLNEPNKTQKIAIVYFPLQARTDNPSWWIINSAEPVKKLTFIQLHPP